MTPCRRPLTITLITIALALAASAVAFGGLAATWTSNCCGSREPANPGYVVAGLVVAVPLFVAAIGAWTGALSRRVVLALCLVLPIACAVGARSSLDLAALLLVTVVAWLLLWWLLRRGQPARWLLS